MEIGLPDHIDPPLNLGGMVLLASLGEQGESCVYIAARPEDHFSRLVTAQRLEATALEDQERGKLFDTLCKARVVRHAQLVEILGVIDDGEHLGLQTSALEGRPLSQLLATVNKQGIALPLGLSVYIIRQALEAWIYARESSFLGGLCRDFEASGIWLQWSGAVFFSPVDLEALAQNWDSAKYCSSTRGAAVRNIPLVGQLLQNMLTFRRERRPRSSPRHTLQVSMAAAASAALTAEAPEHQGPTPDELKLQEIVDRALHKSVKKGWDSIEAMLLALDHWLLDYAPQASQQKFSKWLHEQFGDIIERDQKHCLQLTTTAKAQELAKIASQIAGEVKLCRTLGDGSGCHHTSGDKELPNDPASHSSPKIELGSSKAPTTSTHFLAPEPSPEPSSAPLAASNTSNPNPRRSPLKTVVLPAAPPAGEGEELHDPQSDELPQKTVLAGRYRVTGKLGEGILGAVYSAKHVEMGREVALKLLFHRWSQDADVVGRFREAARAASALRHPNIVDIIDAGKLQDERLFLVMEHLRGRTLRELLRERSTLDFREVAQIGVQVLSALEAAHREGVIHRDLKPENIMLVSGDDPGQSEQVKVIDFGIAAATRTAAMHAPESEELQANPANSVYLAPEQSEDFDPKPGMDLYAVGSILFELLNGKPPFHGQDPEVIAQKKQKEDPPLLLALRRELPPELCRIVDDCLQRDPNARPHDAALLKARLHAFLRKHPPAQRESEGAEAIALRDELAEHSREGKSRLRIGVGLVAALGILSVWWISGNNSQEPGLSQREQMRQRGALRPHQKGGRDKKLAGRGGAAGPASKFSQGGESEFAQKIFRPQNRELEDPNNALLLAQGKKPREGLPGSSPGNKGPVAQPGAALNRASPGGIGLPTANGGRSLSARRNTKIEDIKAIELPETDERAKPEANANEQAQQPKAEQGAEKSESSTPAKASKASSDLDSALHSLSGSSKSKDKAKTKSSSTPSSRSSSKSSKRSKSSSARPDPACPSMLSRINTQGKSISPQELLTRLSSATRGHCFQGRDGRRDRAQWKVYAYKELKDWEQCMNAGRSYNWDRRIASDLAICEARLKRERSQP